MQSHDLAVIANGYYGCVEAVIANGYYGCVEAVIANGYYDHYDHVGAEAWQNRKKKQPGGKKHRGREYI